MPEKTEINNELIDTAICYVRDGVLNTRYSSLRQLKIEILALTKKEQADIEDNVRWSELPPSVNWVGNPFDKWQRNFLIAGATGVALGGANYKLNGSFVLSALTSGVSSLFTTFALFQYDLNNARSECTNRHSRFDEIFADVINRANSNVEFFSLQKNRNVITTEDISELPSPG